MDTLICPATPVQTFPHSAAPNTYNPRLHIKVSLLALLISASLTSHVRAEDYTDTVISDDPDIPRVFLSGDTITVTDSDASAIRAENGGGVSVPDGGVAITVTGTGTADGLNNNVIIINSGSDVNLGTGTTISASGKALGILLNGSTDANDPRPQFKARDLSINTSDMVLGGIDSPGISANWHSDVELTGDYRVTNAGANSGALLSANAGAHITMENAELNAGTGENPASGTSFGIVSQFSSSITGSGTTNLNYDGSGNFFGVVAGASLSGEDAARVQLNDMNLQIRSDGGAANGLWATQSGTINIIGNADLNAQAASGYLVRADRNGTVTLSGASIGTLTADTAWGVWGAGLGNLSLNQSQLAVEGTDAAAVIRADNSAAAGENRFSFVESVLSSNKDGVLVTAGDATITLINTRLSADNGAVINAAGTGTTRVVADNNSQLTGRVQTAEGGTTNLTLGSGSSWNVTEDSRLSNLTLDNGTLRYAGAAALTATDGITLSGGGGTIDTSGNAILISSVLTGDGGLTKTGSGILTLTGTHSYTGGTAISEGTLQLGNGDNPGTIAGNIINNGTLTLNNNAVQQLNNVITGTGQFRNEGAGTTILTGDNTWTGGTLINHGTVQLGDGGTQGSIKGDVTNNSALVVNRSDALTLDGAIGGSGTLRKQGSGELILSGLYSLTGGTYIDAGTLTFSGNTATTNVTGQSGSILNLKNNATLTGWVDPLDMNIESGSTWNVTGTAGQNVLDTLTLAGNINFPGATGGTFTPNTLTVKNLNGQNGTVGLNADLSNGTADRIIVNGGAATGSTNLAVNNVSNTGAPTQGNGILLVETTNNGTTAADAFRLSSPVYGGAYRYSLLRGASDGSAADNWYLTSDQPGSPNPDSQNPGSPNPGTPVWRPGVSVAAATPLIVAGTNMAMMSNFYERTGFYGLNNSDVTPTASMPCEEDLTLWCARESRAWGRYINDNITHKGDGKGIYGDAGAKYDQHINAIQFGNDIWRNVDDTGNRNYAGLYATIGNSRSHVTDYDDSEAGLSRLDAYTLGSYFTHVHHNDAWTDMVFQGSWLKARNQAEDNTRYDTEGFALATSLEGGFPVYETGSIKVEPHARVTYQYENLNDANDGLTEIRFNNFQSLQGSAGIRVSNIGLVNNLKYSVWLDAGAGQEFMGKSKTEFVMTEKTETITTRTRGGFADVKVGGSLDLNKTLAVYTSANWTPRFDNTEYSLGASIGVRGTW